MGAAVPSLLMQSSTLTGLSTAFSIVSTFSQMNAQKEALAR